MPIRLNLLAEAQAAEEMRRRDPVKRALWIAGLVVALMLVWSSFLQLRATLANSEVTRIESQMAARTNEFRQILENQKRTTEMNDKLNALFCLATNRFLNGTLLNALQQTTVEDVQLLRVKVDQLYTRADGTKAHTNSSGVFVRGQPATATERTTVLLEGIDSSANPGDQVNRCKAVLLTNAYFKTMLTQTNAVSLKSLSPLQVAPLNGKPCVMFGLECRFPEKTR